MIRGGSTGETTHQERERGKSKAELCDADRLQKGKVVIQSWDELPSTWTAEELGKRTSIKRSLAHLYLLSLAAPTRLGLVSGGGSGGLDLCRSLGDRLGSLESRAPGVDPFALARAGSCLGWHRVMKQPRSLIKRQRCNFLTFFPVYLMSLSRFTFK